ncbi:MAG: hypothetical protein AAGI25_14090 [Bacteroidota bacterium]
MEPYYQFHEHTDLIDNCDIILANCYPFWEGSSIENASVYLNHMYQSTKEVAKGKPVVITETGWPSSGDSTKDAEPSLCNTMKYFINTNNWRRKHSINVLK